MLKIISILIKKRRLEVEIINEKNKAIQTQIMQALDEYSEIFKNTENYVSNEQIVKWEHKWNGLQADIISIVRKKMKKLPKSKAQLNNMDSFIETKNNILSKQKIHNEKVILLKMSKARSLICPVEGKNLDDQQISCIIKETNNHLVVAGAGAGKTTTVIGNIKYLLKTKQYLAEDILVLSFTNISANEMSVRIQNEVGENVDAMTFHKLGMNIITKIEKKKPSITNIDLLKLTRNSLKKNMDNPIYFNKMINFLLYDSLKNKSYFEFSSQREYDEYLKIYPPMTLNNEKVKSYAEMDIANFLYRNGIEYSYETQYKINTATEEFGRYLPDFYLKQYDIYIEFFAVNKEGNVPGYFVSKNNQSATESYKKSIEWKKKIHVENKTKLIELYFYEKEQGQLLSNLEKKLIKENVILNPKSDKELWDEIADSENGTLDGLTELIVTVINLIKANNISFEQLVELNNSVTTQFKYNNINILQIIEPIFCEYCKELSTNNEIDFNDMINIATKYVAEGRFQHTYKYVIVDEYQDISKSRYNLLKQMRDQRAYKIFCVGDDWQSIYRFAGSDINYLLNFDNYWGISEKSRIETTYRFSDSLINVSSHFIMRNPNQIKKSLRSFNSNNVFSLGVIEGFSKKYAVDFMFEKLKDLTKNCSVYFIGRYSFDVHILDNSKFSYQFNNISGNIDVKCSCRPDIKIEFLTAHKSKGLQADYVFILNNFKNGMGFPSKIEDNSVLQLLLESYDYYDFAEERRLFYVALTRTKKKVWLLIEKGNESEFAQELLSVYEKEIKNEMYTCPQCGGKLRKIPGQYGDFFGCSNYKKDGTGCGYTKTLSNSVSKKT